ATQPSAGRELELVEQQYLQRPACEMPVGGVLERLVKTVCSGSGAGHTLDAVAEVVLEGLRDPGGALSARRKGVAPGKRDDDCLGGACDLATIAARILAGRRPN
ncbi:MAG: hypothetical protein WB462_07045, partial [Solirubrobacterales bacterium]